MAQAIPSTRGTSDDLSKECIALVVEPDRVKRAQAAAILQSVALKTYDTGCGAVGQFIASQLELSVVVIDVVLPDLDGVQLIRRVRALSPDALIIATAPADEDWDAVSECAQEAGADYALPSLSVATLDALVRGGEPPRQLPAPHADP